MQQIENKFPLPWSSHPWRNSEMIDITEWAEGGDQGRRTLLKIDFFFNVLNWSNLIFETIALW